MECDSKTKLPKSRKLSLTQGRPCAANPDDLFRAPPESCAWSRLFRALGIFCHRLIVYTSIFPDAVSCYGRTPRHCAPLRVGMSFAHQAVHARGLCMHVTQISEEQIVMKTDVPNISGSGATGVISTTTGKFDEAASLRTDRHSANHSSAATGLREELTRLKSDLDAPMSHASTLTEM